MKTIDETRRLRLEMLIKKHGKLADLNEALGYERTHSQLARIRNKNMRSDRPGRFYVMGDEQAREIEEKLSLDLGWMDTPPTYAELTGESDPRSDLWKVMEDMTPSDLYRAAAILAALKATHSPAAPPVEEGVDASPSSPTTAPPEAPTDIFAAHAIKGAAAYQQVQVKATPTTNTRRATGNQQRKQRQASSLGASLKSQYARMAKAQSVDAMLDAGKGTTKGAAMTKAMQNLAKAAHKSKA